MTYFVLGELPNTLHLRYALLAGDHTVTAVQISRPDGVEVERPASVRWKIDLPAVRVKYQNAQAYTYSTKANGEQQRKTSWRRSGKRAEGGTGGG